MRETIRFAWGANSLGDFVVAMSNKGIVALEFSPDAHCDGGCIEYSFCGS